MNSDLTVSLCVYIKGMFAFGVYATPPSFEK